MIDESDLLNPSRNFTQAENRPHGARIPEFTFRRMISESLARISKTIDGDGGVLVDELFAMFDPEVVKQVKGFFRDHPNVITFVNWPNQDISLPYVAVINVSEQESPQALLGDYAGIHVRGEASGSRVTVRALKAVPVQAAVDCIVGTNDPNLTMYLHHVVKYLFYVNKGALSAAFDVHNLVVSGRDLALDERMFPTTGFYKTLSLQFLTLFDFALSESAAVIASVGLKVDVLVDGERAVVDVPGEEG